MEPRLKITATTWRCWC